MARYTFDWATKGAELLAHRARALQHRPADGVAVVTGDPQQLHQSYIRQYKHLARRRPTACTGTSSAGRHRRRTVTVIERPSAVTCTTSPGRT